MAITQSDVYFMTLALAEAKKGIYITRPNPSVGCILVHDKTIIGQGYTSPAGGNHGEINALANANEQGFTKNILGATAYVTLEPCSHYGRTPPCAKRLVEEGIKRVVIAGLDPNPQVAGRGVTILKEAGVEVVTFPKNGSIHRQAEEINKGFLQAMRTGMPYVRLKTAISLDGRIALSSGESKWITGNEAREDVQYLRALSGAIITGSQTIINDNPSLNVRSNNLNTPLDLIPQPKVVILDRSNRLNLNSDYKVCQNEHTLFWRNNDLSELLTTLKSTHKCHDILIEAGSKVSGSFIRNGLVDELIIYQAPCLLGTDSHAMFDLQIAYLTEQYRFNLVSHETIGNDLKMIFQKTHS